MNLLLDNLALLITILVGLVIVAWLVRHYRDKSRWRKVSPWSYLVLIFMIVVSAFPFYWMYIVASNGNEEISKNPPTLVPGDRFLTLIGHVFEAAPTFGISIWNTVVVGTVISVAQVVFSALAGFAFAKLNFKGRNFLILFVIGTMMLPSQLGIIPLFMIVNDLGWGSTLTAIVVPALVTAFGVFWMRQIIDAQVPNELLEAASIDGAGVIRVFRSVVLPIIAQSSFVLGLFAFLGTWNDFLWPLLVLNDPNQFTVQVAVNQLSASYTIDYALMLGGAFLATAPLLLLFVLVGRQLVSGVMDGAVKG
jgi:cellobiose transport system permease protein